MIYYKVTKNISIWGKSRWEIYSRHTSLENLIYKIIKHQPETYSDKARLKPQLMRNRFRSFNALLEIANTYYPGTSDKDLLRVLNNIYKKHPRGIKAFYCPDVKKVVFTSTDPADGTYQIGKTFFSSFGHYGTQNVRRRGKGYQINKLLKLLKEIEE